MQRVPLVLCASGVPAGEKAALKAACERLGVPLLKEWRADVTHLVMPQCAVRKRDTCWGACALASHRAIAWPLAPCSTASVDATTHCHP